jgi:carotenoid 1,2-hydratase
LTVIAFIGSVFSPYYAWAGRKDPFNHCAINVALYGPRCARWAMTERRRTALSQQQHRLAIGPSAVTWDGNALQINVDEISAPLPRRIRGVIRLEPDGVNRHVFTLDANHRHFWRPIAPSARVSVDMTSPDIKWSGNGYLDMNHGSEPLESAFRSWTWSRACLPTGAGILYDADRRNSESLSLALRFDQSGSFERVDPPKAALLPRTKWFMPRETRADDGVAQVRHTFEDTPFYSRSEITSTLFGERVKAVHESLSLDRVSHPLVRLMLPFRMPRR